MQKINDHEVISSNQYIYTKDTGKLKKKGQKDRKNQKTSKSTAS